VQVAQRFFHLLAQGKEQSEETGCNKAPSRNDSLYRFAGDRRPQHQRVLDTRKDLQNDVYVIDYIGG
jgi:hypothetical protein